MSELTLKKNYTINDKVVYQMTTIGEIKVFSDAPIDEYDDSVTLYFVMNNEVVKTLSISADMGQGQGYLSDLSFK